MKNYFSLAMIVLTLAGCKKNNTESLPETKPEDTIQNTTDSSVPRDCYQANLEGNIIELQIQYNPEDITGTLTYAFTGKDVSQGTFKGKLENNVLVADYTYASEGVVSERQVAFKLIDDQFVEGYGERVKNGTQFKDLSKLNYNTNMPLKKVECP